jgi:DNA-binding transcriptional LysR family regulator
MTKYPDLAVLADLVLVARLGSIGQAATATSTSQPSMSRRMSALERSLGVSLLSRSRRGTTLTAQGRVVVDWADHLLDAAQQFNDSVHTLSEQTLGTVRVAVSMTIAEQYAPSWVARFRRTMPTAEVSLLVHNSSEVADLVDAGEVDVGFVESPTVRPSLQRRRIAWDQLMVAVEPGHPWARRRRPLSADEIATASLLVRESGSGARETLERALGEKGLRISAGLVMGSNTALKSAAMTGMGPVVLSERSLTAELEAGLLVRVPIEDLALRRPLTAVWRRNKRVTPGVSALIDVARQAC